MTAMGTEVQYRRLRVPREHGATLIEPPRQSAESLLCENVALRSSFERCDVYGQSLLALSEDARRLLLEDAHRYTCRYRDVSIPVLDTDGRSPTILLSGHQPQLSHAGVWFKSFVTDALAQRTNAVGIQLLIDNDVVRTASIRVPCGSIGQPALQHVSLDRPARELPYEERGIVDIDLFSTFAGRVQQVIRTLVPSPLVLSMWPWATAAARTGLNLGQCLAQARHRLEGDWGLSTLELPLSHVCDTAPFRRFMLHMCEHLPIFHTLHNDALHEYRVAHHIRSRSHPVSDLAAEDDWLEAPFWIWTKDDPRRRPLWVQSSAGRLQLRAGRQHAEGIGSADPAAKSLWFPIDRDVRTSMDQLRQLRGQGVKIRPRALITTMYARLVLGDLFIHGIGGSKYDQLTDLLIQRFFHVDPPAFLTVSATFLLPLVRANVAAEDLRHVDWLLRDLWYHPERHLDNGSAQANPDWRSNELVGQKRSWVNQRPPRDKRLARHREIERLNEQLRKQVQDQRERLIRERSRLNGLLRDDSILSSREYAFCLFPESELRGPLHQLASAGWDEVAGRNQS